MICYTYLMNGPRSFLKAVLTLTGTIIGAGLFGLPAAFAAVGFWPGTILFFFLAGTVMVAHLLYVEVILASHKKQRLTGYAKDGLGQVGFDVAAITYPLQIVGANVAYIILGGEFLILLAAAVGIGLPLSVWQFGFWLIGAVLVLFGLRLVAAVESLATILLLSVLAIAIGLVFPRADAGLIQIGSWEGFFLPFGVFLFSLSGLSIVSETVEIAGRNRARAYGAVSVGTMIAALFSWLFGITLYLAAGGFPIRYTHELVSILPAGWGLLIPLLGFLAIITSYITTAEDLRATLQHDFAFSRVVALAAALLSPLVIFILITRDFLSTIGFVGAVFIGTNYTIVSLLAWKIASRYRRPFVRFAASFLCVMCAAVFIFGAVQRLFSQTVL